MIAHAITIVGFIGLAIAVADLYLSEDVINDFFINVWIKLDDWREIPFRKMIRSTWLQVFSAILVVSINMADVLMPEEGIQTIWTTKNVIVTAVFVLLPSIAPITLVRWCLSPTGVRLIRAVISLIIALIIVPMIIYKLTWWSMPALDPTIHYYPTDFGVPAFFSFAYSVICGLLVVGAMILPFLAVRIIRLLLWLLEPVMRWAAQSPKVCAVGGALAALVGVLLDAIK